MYDLNNNLVFDSIDKVIFTLYNEPSLGLYYTQQHIHATFPKLINHMDILHENRNAINRHSKDIDGTLRDLKELASLNENYSYRLLAKINSMNYALEQKK